MKRVFIAAACVFFSSFFVVDAAYGDDRERPFVSSMKIDGGPSFPVGDTSEMFRIGGSGDISVHHRLKRLPFLNLFVSAGFSGLPLLDQSASVLFSDLSLGAGVEFEIVPRLSFEAFVSGGAYWGYLTDPERSDFGGLFGAGVQLGYDITGSLRVGAGLLYSSYPGVSEQLVVTANSALRFDFRLDESFQSSGMEWEPYYPQLASYYAAGMPLGRIVLKNAGDASWKKLHVRFDIPGMSRGWTDVPSDDQIGSSEILDLALLGDFSAKDRQRKVEEDIDAQVEIDFRYKGWPQERSLRSVVSVRNADFTEHPETVSLFVSSRDPVIRDWAGAAVGHGLEISDEVNSGLAAAAVLFEALNEQGYIVRSSGADAWSSVLGGNPAAGDFPFPRDTLMALEGDATESAVLMAALLEAVGYPAGLVAVDDVFFPAVSLGEGPERIAAEYSRPRDLSLFDGIGWAVFDPASDDFLDAMASGADAVALAGSDAVLVSLRESWTEYPQAGYSRDPITLDLPASGELSDRLASAIDALIRWEIASRRSSLETAIAAAPRDIDLMNSLGALLARYGLRDEAADWFDRVLLLDDDPRALVNMANIEFLKDDLTRARTYYNQAYRVDPFNPYVLLGLARVDFEQENFGTSRDAYSKLEFVDPDLADRFAVLTGTGPDALEKARNSELRRVVFWQE